jgi:hypothetical protein
MHPDDIIPLGFCQCGCGQRPGVSPSNDAPRGYIKGAPRRFVSGHNKLRPIVDPSRYRVDPETGCWAWKTSSAGGYGVIRVNDRTCKAHRVFYEALVGPIPDGLDIDHLCRNKACVNPDHLEPVTTAVNVQRGVRVKLSPPQVREIRSLRGVLTQARIAEQFGVSLCTVWEIQNGHKWKNV